MYRIKKRILSRWIEFDHIQLMETLTISNNAISPSSQGGIFAFFINYLQSFY